MSSVLRVLKRSVIHLARTSTDPDERADFFERDARCREHRLTSFRADPDLAGASLKFLRLVAWRGEIDAQNWRLHRLLCERIRYGARVRIARE